MSLWRPVGCQQVKPEASNELWDHVGDHAPCQPPDSWFKKQQLSTSRQQKHLKSRETNHNACIQDNYVLISNQEIFAVTKINMPPSLTAAPPAAPLIPQIPSPRHLDFFPQERVIKTHHTRHEPWNAGRLCNDGILIWLAYEIIPE